MIRVLFFPWGHGGGAGYTGRCLALADRLRAAGFEVAFSDCGRSSMVRAAGIRVVDTGLASELDPGAVPPYLAFANVERVFSASARYYRADRFQRQLDSDVTAIRAVRPDVVVYDMSPTAAIAARAAGLPTVSLADADFLSPLPNAWMPWADVSPELLMPYPSCLPVVNAAVARAGLPPIEHFGELLQGELTLIPSIEELDPILGGPVAGDVRYVGPLYWDPPDGPHEPFEERARDGAPRVYVTLGSGFMCSPATLTNLLEACSGQDWQVYVSLGYADRARPPAPSNVRLGGFTGLSRPIRWADVVVSHGGYSTVTATLLMGRPSLVLPFMSEQEANGRAMVEGQGAGRLLVRTSVDAKTRRLHFHHRSGGRTRDPTISASDLRAAVEEVLCTPAFAERAAALSMRLSAAGHVDLPGLVRSVV